MLDARCAGIGVVGGGGGGLGDGGFSFGDGITLFLLDVKDKSVVASPAVSVR